MSLIIARFSSSVVRSARSTWSACDFATMAMYSVSASTRARVRASSEAFPPALRVAPNATSFERWRPRPFASWKNSVSAGFAPGQPPSMKVTPSSSR